MKKLAAINVNFDSLNEAYGFPAGYEDPSFFRIADRFLDAAARFKFKYSLYLIGRDLESARNRARVREWAGDGHEIGNHSWSHPLNLGSLPDAAIAKEVHAAHDLIAETAGTPPRGFIAPGWATSPALLRRLIDAGYGYDTSLAPSWLMAVAVAKNLYNHLGSDKFARIHRRKDLGAQLWGPRHPFVSDGGLRPRASGASPGILVLPLPTNRYRVACWHTLSFVLGWPRFEKLLRSCLADCDAFYYLVHPLDLADAADLDPSRKIHLERAGIPLAKKREHFERALEVIVSSGREIRTMGECAEVWRRDASGG